jgi:hypothetical protein
MRSYTLGHSRREGCLLKVRLYLTIGIYIIPALFVFDNDVAVEIREISSLPPTQ